MGVCMYTKTTVTGALVFEYKHCGILYVHMCICAVVASDVDIVTHVWVRYIKVANYIHIFPILTTYLQ